MQRIGYGEKSNRDEAFRENQISQNLGSPSMKHPEQTTAKAFYKQLRTLSPQQLWDEEIPRFDRATAPERMARVGLIRAMGVVFAESGTDQDKEKVKAWLLALLNDPQEKVRRYAMAALPKLRSGAEAEAALLSVLQTTENDREKKYLSKTLDKIGGAATLKLIESGTDLMPRTEQKIKASVSRSAQPSRIRLDRPFTARARLRIHLRCRAGLEGIVRDEAEEQFRQSGKFRLLDVHKGLVAITPLKAFTLADLYSLRCFASVSFVLQTVKPQDEAASVKAWASQIASPLAESLLRTFTDGAIRYRLNFIDTGARRGLVREVVTRAYTLCPAILNDPREAPWSVDIHPIKQGTSVELRPRISPDPRLFYRIGDVPAASHPPLAACLARLARTCDQETVWDPFCGSGLELIERALLGGVKKLYGTDLSEAAIAITAKNIEAAGLNSVKTQLTCCDFKNFSTVKGLGPASITLVISNPPLGRRVRIIGLRDLFTDFFRASAIVLKPGGKLVFVNPFRMESPEPTLQLQSRQTVDLGGFQCHLEVYCKRQNM
jgi:23S rRNA G2445 N2-methylase RlmL